MPMYDTRGTHRLPIISMDTGVSHLDSSSSPLSPLHHSSMASRFTTVKAYRRQESNAECNFAECTSANVPP